MTTSSDTSIQRPGRRIVIAAAIVGLLLVLLLLGPLAYRMHYRDRIYPGVTVSGLDVGGLTAEEAAAQIAEQQPGHDEVVELVDPGDKLNLLDDRSWTFTRAELGLVPDPWAAADAAYREGRNTANPLTALWTPLLLRLGGEDVAAKVPWDAETARQALIDLKEEVDLAPRNAVLEVRNGELVERSASPGRTMDVDRTLDRLMVDAQIPGPVTSEIATIGLGPRVGDVSNVAEAYRKIVSAPVRLIFLEEIEHLISVDLLKQWVTLEDLPNEEGDLVPSIVVDTNAIQEYVEQFAEHVNRPPRDARFSYDVNSGKVSLRTPAESGYVFDAPTTARNVIDAAYTEPRVAEIAVLETRPAVTSRAFGNSDDVFLEIANSGTSVTGMPSGRLNNIIIAADRLNGVAIPPGEEFSFNHNLGLVDEAKGYDMVQIDQQQPPLRADPVGLGGGIEQLATSVFRAALWAGYPITERRAPAWRIGWVEPPVGLDASAGTARADLKFINDTKDIALLTAEVDVLRKALMVRIYGKKGRSKRVVELQGPDVTNVTPAGGVIERRDDRLVAGTRVQVGWAREGAEAVVRRTVLQDGVEVLRDAFLSVYEPASDVIVVGTGKPEDGGE